MLNRRNLRQHPVPGRAIPTPRSAIVVGAGVVGLATAWHLRRAGLEVTVLEQDKVAAGSSWGNAGWLTPPITTPLPEPAILRTGLKALYSPNSPLYVPLRPDFTMIRFMLGFLRHSTAGAWKKAMGSYIPWNRQSLEAFDELADGGVQAPTKTPKAFLACFNEAGQNRMLMEEFEQIRDAGQPVAAELIDGDAARQIAPALSANVVEAIRLDGVRFINPPEYMTSLAEAAIAEGVQVREKVTVTDVDGGTPGQPASVTIQPGQQTSRSEHSETDPAPAGSTQDILTADVVVLASGAWIGDLAKKFGVRSVVQAGRGYSFSIPVDPAPEVPLYFPAQRVACTPLDGRLRVAGMMEFRRPDDALDPRRVQAIIGATQPMLQGADFTDRADEWVGSRPCTPDGLPLVGRTNSPRVIMAGGHGMWGVTLGPLTGRLLAEDITTGVAPEMLAPFNPLR